MLNLRIPSFDAANGFMLDPSKPTLLDLFCGVGGSGVGYNRAGFNIVGVDHKAQPNYPFWFIQMDAIEFLTKVNLKQFNIKAIAASPPCQAYSRHVSSDGRWSHGKHKGFNEPRYIADLREMFIDIGMPYIIENVFGARDDLINPILLCGVMFGLGTRRHRLFESSIPLTQPDHPSCRGVTHPVAEEWIKKQPTGRNRRIYSVVGKGRQTGSVDVWKVLMGIDWATHDYELSEAVPPAYTEYVGKEMIMNGRFL
jgi:DNA (cytosine-5)-methyltransferase 1